MLKNGITNGHCIIECKTEVKKCEKIWARYPFLQDSTVIVNDFDTRCAIMKNGKVRCNSSDNSSSERLIIDGVDDAISIDYRAGHGCALQANGLVKCWGDNSHGELGNGTKATDYSNYRSVATTVIGLD